MLHTAAKKDNDCIYSITDREEETQCCLQSACILGIEGSKCHVRMAEYNIAILCVLLTPQGLFLYLNRITVPVLELHEHLK